MTRRSQLAHLVIFLAALTGLVWALTGSLAPPTGDASIWLHAGLLMLILGVYWIESYFTKPSDVVINGLVVYVSSSTLENPPLADWWNLLRFGSLGLVVVAFFVVWAGSPAVQADASRLKRIIYLVVIRLGASEVLYSAVFLLDIGSYFDLEAPETRWLVAFWALLLAAKKLDLDGLVASIGTLFRQVRAEPVGRVSRFAEPDVVRFQINQGESSRRGSLVAFTSGGTIECDTPLGIVVGHRTGTASVEAEAILIDSAFEEGAIDDRTIVVPADPRTPSIQSRLETNPIGSQLPRLVGFARRSSDISRLRFELTRGVGLEEGQLVSALLPGGGALLYQVTNGVLHEEATFEAGERAFVVAEAQQVGTWDPDEEGFRSYPWVVKENAPIFREEPNGDIATASAQARVHIGEVPASSYPAKIIPSDLVLYHSAILGVTGSGKSFLAYHLIENCARSGIKVLCLDITGDYKRYLAGAVRIRSAGHIQPFLDQDGGAIGIVEFSEDGQRHPISSTRDVSREALGWCRSHREAAEIREPRPKVLLVLEEAHCLVPEWNSNPVRNLQDTVNQTAQDVLQARKFGLGFMIVTQRTANVTKSILNQCNTLFAFQAYDETGFDFMRNYMGEHHVRALPNLRKRQAVVVGKASPSDRPLIVEMHDQTRLVVEEEAPFFAPPDAPAAMAEGA